MALTKIIIGKYLLIALIVAVIILIFMFYPTITSDMPKTWKWIGYFGAGATGFVVVTMLLLIGECFMTKSSSVSKLLGGHSQPKYSDNLFGNMNKVNDLFG